jgi:hypothetical protein
MRTRLEPFETEVGLPAHFLLPSYFFQPDRNIFQPDRNIFPATTPIQQEFCCPEQRTSLCELWS